MTDPDPAEVTRLLQAMERGDDGAVDALAPLVYEQLRHLAIRALRNEPSGHTLQPTALVHEAFVALVGQRATVWQNRAHFFAIAGTAMRRILVDHARRRLAAKRDGGVRVTLADWYVSGDGEPEARALDMIALEEAMVRLEAVDERGARVVELRFFAGLELKETASALNVSLASVKRDWAFARAFLRRELEPVGGP